MFSNEWLFTKKKKTNTNLLEKRHTGGNESNKKVIAAIKLIIDTNLVK